MCPVLSPTVNVGKPCKPRSLNVTDNSIELEWTKPVYGAENIIYYKIIYRSVDDLSNQWKEVNVDNVSQGMMIIGLHGRTEYIFKVVCIDNDGRYGIESDPTDPIRTA